MNIYLKISKYVNLLPLDSKLIYMDKTLLDGSK